MYLRRKPLYLDFRGQGRRGWELELSLGVAVRVGSAVRTGVIGSIISHTLSVLVESGISLRGQK